MGAWGTGIFDNDTACDWAYSLEESSDLSVVESAMDKVLAIGPEYLEASDAEEALAAIEVIARLQGNFDEKNSYTETVDAWVGANKLMVSAELAKKALVVIDRILSEPSEILEIWNEGEDFNAWKGNLVALKTRVRA